MLLMSSLNEVASVIYKKFTFQKLSVCMFTQSQASTIRGL